jgi:hypothetical protein
MKKTPRRPRRGWESPATKQVVALAGWRSKLVIATQPQALRNPGHWALGIACRPSGGGGGCNPAFAGAFYSNKTTQDTRHCLDIGC